MKLSKLQEQEADRPQADEPHEPIERIIKAAEAACFVVETVAHLKGRESELLPIADELRAAIAALRSAS